MFTFLALSQYNRLQNVNFIKQAQRLNCSNLTICTIKCFYIIGIKKIYNRISFNSVWRAHLFCATIKSFYHYAKIALNNF